MMVLFGQVIPPAVVFGVAFIAIDLPAGEYRYFCDVVGHDSMQGTLTVR